MKDGRKIAKKYKKKKKENLLKILVMKKVWRDLFRFFLSFLFIFVVVVVTFRYFLVHTPELNLYVSAIIEKRDREKKRKFLDEGFPS